MTLPAVTFTITPNVNTGDQLLSDPTGSDTPTTALEPVTNLRVTSNASTGQQIAWSYDGSGHDGFDITAEGGGGYGEVQVGPTIRNFTSGVLPSETLITWRVRAYADDGSTSEWRTVQETTEAPPDIPVGGDTDLSRITLFENFESGANGQSINSMTSNPFSGANYGTVTTSEAYPGGTRCMQTYTPIGNHAGFGNWGFIWEGGSFPQLTEGGEIWCRFALKYPAGFSFYANPATKFMRIRKEIPSGANRGYNDAYIYGGRNYGFIVELPHDSWPDDLPENERWEWSWQFAQERVPDGEWFFFEYYVKLGLYNLVNGGDGHQKWWQNGIRGVPGQHERMSTLNPQGWISSFLWHTHWNEDSYENQVHFCDQVAFAFKGQTRNMGYIDDTPYMARDAQGHPYIGVTTG